MSLLGKMERRLGRWAIPNMTMYLVFGQAVCFLLLLADPTFYAKLILVPQAVLGGEYWRLLMFLFMPPVTDPIFLLFGLILLYLMGSTLERDWGAFRYNVFLLVGYVASVGVSFLEPTGVATNVYLMGSIFLAFAYLYPDFILRIFFIFPVKIKWLALLTWAGYGFIFVNGITTGLQTGNWMACLMILAACANFLLFFGRDIVVNTKNKIHHTRYRMQHMASVAEEARTPFHQCVVCGASDKSHPQMEFRYCSQCQGSPCYCLEHINKHTHR